MPNERETCGKERERQLEGIIRDVLWMACRYAHGRQSYAVGSYNDAAKLAIKLGVVKDDGREPLLALDGSMSPRMSGLTAAEFKLAWDRWRDPDCVPNFARDRREHQPKEGANG